MFQKIFGSLRAAAVSSIAYIKKTAYRLGWRKIAIGAGVLVVILLLIHFLSGSTPAEVVTTNTRAVAVRSVADLSNDTSALSVGGTVSSKSEATVRAETSGEVRSLNYQLGDQVGAGAVVAEVENASQRAAVLQAQAGVQAAQASAGISGSSAVSTLLSAYAAIDNAVHNTADPMFINPNSTPHSYFLRVHTTNGAAKRDAETLRSALDPVLARETAASDSLSASSNLTGELVQTQSDLRQVRDFLDTLILALNDASPDEVVTADVLAGYKANAIAARTSITSSLAAAGSAAQSVSSDAGASVSSAALTQAEAGLAAARANLEHTIVRAPISGTINSLSLKLGDYIQTGAAVLTVANNNALEVVAYVTQTDATELAVGSSATINGSIGGVITRLAPAIDPVTKKIEVRIGINGNASELQNGQSVTVDLARSSEKETAAPSRLIIPLSALKIGAQDMSVFTLDANHMLVAHTVVIGELLGDRVVVEEGLTPDMEIVTDARGLRAGETVQLAQ